MGAEGESRSVICESLRQKDSVKDTKLFNGCGFGPPLPFTATSTWTWIDHPVSGLLRLTMRPIQTWFPFGSGPLVLNLASRRDSPDRSTKSTRLNF